jgi:hypothetical protein
VRGRRRRRGGVEVPSNHLAMFEHSALREWTRSAIAAEACCCQLGRRSWGSWAASVAPLLATRRVCVGRRLASVQRARARRRRGLGGDSSRAQSNNTPVCARQKRPICRRRARWQWRALHRGAACSAGRVAVRDAVLQAVGPKGPAARPITRPCTRSPSILQLPCGCRHAAPGARWPGFTPGFPSRRRRASRSGSWPGGRLRDPPTRPALHPPTSPPRLTSRPAPWPT